MKTISITLYQFGELGRHQQDKALEEFRYINVMDQDWFEFTKDDFCRICKILGIHTEPENISFHGFYSQGDGSTFSSVIDLLKFIKGTGQQSWKKIAPALKLDVLPCTCDARVISLIENGVIGASVKTVSCLGYQLKYESEYDLDRKSKYSNIDNELKKLDSWVEQSMEALNTFLFKSLQDEYEYQISHQSVQESIEANEYVFTANGKFAGDLVALAND